MSFTPTVGPTGGVKNRLNVVDFVKDDKFFTLYIRALAEIQQEAQERGLKGEEHYTSFFRLGGIHGLPFEDWAKKQQSTNPGSWGYCTHGSVLFPTWHRTYVSIFEQAIQNAAIKVAAGYTHDKEAWTQAALDLRQPYWDWGFQAVPPDELITKEKVWIVNESGTKVEVPNPLLRYKFHPIHPSFLNKEFEEFLLRASEVTVRHPNSRGEEDIHGLIKQLKDYSKFLRDATRNTLGGNYTWNSFSNHSARGDTKASSLEAIHDIIHGLVGQGQTYGHMSLQFWAAFDPIFWFHHANVDRLLSLWQALNPKVWVSEGDTTEPNFAYPDGTRVGVNTPLEPFYKTEDEVWTSASLQDTRPLGYSYPEFENLVGADPSLVRETIHDLVARRYGTQKPKGASNSALDLLLSFQGATEEHTEDIKMFDWSIHATFKKFELKHTFNLVFYFAADDGDYDKTESIIGCVTAFRGSTPKTCDNCRNNEDMVQEGFVHLNRILAERAIGSFDPDDVLNYLKENKLSCKLYTNEATTLSSLTLEVKGLPLHIPPGKFVPQVDESKEPVVRTGLIPLVPLVSDRTA